ncbi:serine hydrolase domain-containing protein [Amycolatopsis benzoatilytica]|uniref:serine hydrolase domain-containing protein n=1 Tax=Amycolatopsis benzoatilytica TaxID=346045 RepID=UPI00037233B9|nr:serine hydrolase domain-containing protein [Amycolatopsis benzoatilytica]
MKLRKVLRSKVIAIFMTAATTLSAGVAVAAPGSALASGLAKLTGPDGVIGAIGMARKGNDAEYARSGFGDYFAKAPPDPHAKFRIGSNTKAFVSVVLLQLEAERKLSLNDTVDKWLPGVVAKNGNDGTKITLRQLLNHTSGLPDYLAGQFAQGYSANLNPNEPYVPRHLVNAALANKPTAAPGTAWHYSNTNYVLAGMVIQAATGNPPAVEVAHRIITPLGLSDTTFPTSDPTLPAPRLNGYFHVHGSTSPVRDVTSSNVQTTGSAGAMVSTVDDLADFERALFAGKLLPPAQQEELETTVPMGHDPAAGRYGLGVGQTQTPCGPVWTHTGAVLGYESTWLSSPDGERQVVVADNEYSLTLNPAVTEDLFAQPVAAYCALPKT